MNHIPSPVKPLGMTLVLLGLLIWTVGCADDSASTTTVDADIQAKANQPAVAENSVTDSGTDTDTDTDTEQSPGLTDEEMAIEPETTIDPVQGEDATDLAYRELSWDDLLPPDFDFKVLREQIDLESYDIASLTDEDPEAQRLYDDLQSLMSDVPMVVGLDGLDAQVPGFLVPLEMAADTVTEFFLVPYFGACIHSPPPPANQIVHVVLDEAVAFDNLYEPYWARGTLEVTQTETDLGTAGYRMVNAEIRPYE